MITGIGCPKRASALRRPTTIADGLASRCRNRVSRLLRPPRIRPRLGAIRHPRDDTLCSTGPIAACRPTAHHQIPITL